MGCKQAKECQKCLCSTCIAECSFHETPEIVCVFPVLNCPDFVPESTKQNCLCVSCATPCTQCDVCSEPITKCKSFTAKEN